MTARGQWRRLWRAFGDLVGGGRGPRHHGTIAGADPVKGPLNDVEALYLRYDFYVRYTETYRNREYVYYRDVGTATYGGPLVVRLKEGLVLLPEAGFEVDFDESSRDGLPLDGPLPPDLAHLMNEPVVSKGPLCYRQYSLSAGDAVELRAKLVPARGAAGGGPYRGDGGHDFVGEGVRGRPALVIDRSVTEDFS